MKRIFFFIAILAVLCAVSVSVYAEVTRYVDGTYLKEYNDPELGSVTVSVVVNQGKLESIDFPAGTGDVTLSEDDLESFTQSLVAAPDFMEIDAISGASTSCELVKYAVLSALEKAEVK